MRNPGPAGTGTGTLPDWLLDVPNVGTVEVVSGGVAGNAVRIHNQGANRRNILLASYQSTGADFTYIDFFFKISASGDTMNLAFLQAGTGYASGNVAAWLDLNGSGNAGRRLRAAIPAGFTMPVACDVANNTWRRLRLIANNSTFQHKIQMDSAASPGPLSATCQSPWRNHHANVVVQRIAVMDWSGGDGKYIDIDQVQVFEDSVDPVTDVSGPTITGYQLAADNSYIDLTFSEPVYGSASGSGPVMTGAFSISFNQNGGLATTASLDSISRADTTALLGGETTLRLGLAIAGQAVGKEIITVSTLANSVFDQNSNGVAASSQPLSLNSSITISSELSATVAAPSIFKANRHQQIRFLHVTDDLTIRVYNLNGVLLFEKTVTGSNGTYSYSCTTNSGALLGSGVYFARITTNSGQSKVLKFAVVR